MLNAWYLFQHYLGLLEITSHQKAKSELVTVLEEATFWDKLVTLFEDTTKNEYSTVSLKEDIASFSNNSSSYFNSDIKYNSSVDEKILENSDCSQETCEQLFQDWKNSLTLTSAYNSLYVFISSYFNIMLLYDDHDFLNQGVPFMRFNLIRLSLIFKMLAFDFLWNGSVFKRYFILFA